MATKNLKTYLGLLFFLSLFFVFFFNAQAQTNLAEKLKGLILLQVEDKGKAWYIYPENQKRYYLGKPADALATIQEMGRGITNQNLSQIPVNLDFSYGPDSDQDGIGDRLEEALGTNPNSPDSDNDGYDDKTEIENNYNPLGQGKISLNQGIISDVQGFFLIQTEEQGEAWYVYPKNQQRYYLGRPADALEIMKKLSLGIKNSDLDKISPAQIINPPDDSTSSPLSASESLEKTGEHIRTNNISQALTFFSPKIKKSVEYSLNNLNEEQKFLFAGILSEAKLKNSTDNKKTFYKEVFFGLGGYEAEQKIILEKQEDGNWLISSL